MDPVLQELIPVESSQDDRDVLLACLRKKLFCYDKIYIYFSRALFFRRSWCHAEDQMKVFGFSLGCFGHQGEGPQCKS